MMVTPLRKPLILDPADPLPAARLFLDRHHTRNRLRTLHHQAGRFYTWTGTRYEIADEQSIRSDLYGFLETAERRGKKGKALPYQPTATKVNNVIDAVRAITNVSSTMS